jgi:hypothetical protein
MSVVLVGGMDRLERHYVSEAEKLGINLSVHTNRSSHLSSRVMSADAVVVFTNKVSHRLRKEVMKRARSGGVPVYHYHSCGVCTLRNCLNCLKKEEEKNAHTV